MADLRVPALERGERALDRGAVGPVFAAPFVVLGPADKVQQLAARHEVMHEMAARPDPGLTTELELEIGEALDRDEPAIGDAAGEFRRLLPKQDCAHRRMNAVGADQHVGVDAHAVIEPRLDMAALVAEPEEAMTEMDALERQTR